MNISDASARNAVNESAVAVYPSLVEQVVEAALRDSLHRNLHLLALGVSDAETYILAYLSVEQWEVVHSGFNLLAVDALNDAAGFYARILHIERTTLDNLLNLQAVTLILRVEEYTQVGCGERAVRSVVAGSCMRSVQLAQHFAQHLLEVEIVVDVRQELLIGLAVTFPVNTMNLRVVELVFHLSPYVVEEILALLGWLIVEVSLEADVLGAESAQIHLLDAASVADKEVLHILVGLQVALTYALHHELGRAVLQVVLPEVVIILEGSLVVELVAVFREHSITHVRRVCGEAYDSVAAVFDVQFQWFYLFHLYLSGLLLLFVSLLFSLFLLLVFLLLLFVLVGVSQFYLFLAHVEAVVGVQVEEHDVGIVFSSPASMTAVAGSVALEEHCLAVEHPFAVAVAVAGIGQVVNLFAVSLYQRNILVVPAAVADIG